MNQLKDQLVAVKMTVWEKSVFTRRANAKGQTLSQYVRGFAYLSPDELMEPAETIKTKAQK